MQKQDRKLILLLSSHSTTNNHNLLPIRFVTTVNVMCFFISMYQYLYNNNLQWSPFIHLRIKIQHTQKHLSISRGARQKCLKYDEGIQYDRNNLGYSRIRDGWYDVVDVFTASKSQAITGQAAISGYRRLTDGGEWIFNLFTGSVATVVGVYDGHVCRSQVLNRRWLREIR